MISLFALSVSASINTQHLAVLILSVSVIINTWLVLVGEPGRTLKCHSFPADVTSSLYNLFFSPNCLSPYLFWPLFFTVDADLQTTTVLPGTKYFERVFIYANYFLKIFLCFCFLQLLKARRKDRVLLLETQWFLSLGIRFLPWFGS